jgi:hypothetical protein
VLPMNTDLNHVDRRKIMTGRILCTMFVVAAGATALAASAAKDPKTLVLQPSDFPAGATRQPLGSVISGGVAKIYTVTFNFRKGSREEEVTSDLAVSTNPRDAATEYKLMVAQNTGLKGDTALHLPAYGDEQYADFFLSPMRARGEVIVRKNNVVWNLTIENCGPLAPAGCLGGSTPPKLTVSQALAELKKFAPKQKARVGSG